MRVIYEIFDDNDFCYDKIVKNPIGFKQEPIEDNDFNFSYVQRGKIIKPFLQSYEYAVMDTYSHGYNTVTIKIIPYNHWAKEFYKRYWRKLK